VDEKLRGRRRNILNIAHRGASAYRPENTMEAFLEAIALGADMIEMDVRKTLDGHLVLLHDETVDRTTDGTGSISELTLKQAKALDAGTGSRIPLLEEVFSHFLRDEVMLNLEIKCPDIEAGVVEMIHRLFRGDGVLISSFLPPVLRKVGEIDGRLKIGLLVGRMRPINPVVWMRELFPLSTLRELGADELHQHVSLTHPYLVWRCQREGIPGIDGIFTNRPDVLSRVIHEEIGKA
jgi:glycerophosphoryl diester phosphodiesterase